jgi:hypothetical protein
MSKSVLSVLLSKTNILAGQEYRLLPEDKAALGSPGSNHITSRKYRWKERRGIIPKPGTYVAIGDTEKFYFWLFQKKERPD